LDVLYDQIGGKEEGEEVSPDNDRRGVAAQLRIESIDDEDGERGGNTDARTTERGRARYVDS
jgi:hypothetical protein